MSRSMCFKGGCTEPAEVGPLCRLHEIERLEERSNANCNLSRKYKAQLDAVRPYLKHGVRCNHPASSCTCGLDAILNPKGDIKRNNLSTKPENGA